MRVNRAERLKRCSDAARRPGRGALAAVIMFVALASACAGGSPESSSSGWPWGTDSVTPAEFAKELSGAPGADTPVVVCTAPPFLYRIGHIPGAVLHGPASSPDGLNSLAAWAQALPRLTNLVIYCGCCPLADCPNLAQRTARSRAWVSRACACCSSRTTSRRTGSTPAIRSSARHGAWPYQDMVVDARHQGPRAGLRVSRPDRFSRRFRSAGPISMATRCTFCSPKPRRVPLNKSSSRRTGATSTSRWSYGARSPSASRLSRGS